MIPILSLITSLKDYFEVVHNLIEFDVFQTSQSASTNLSYTELGSILTYISISLKTFLIDFLSLSWLKNFWSIPIIIPDISSSMISEISVLDGYFHNAFNFLDTPITYGEHNSIVLCFEKFTIGLINSFFLFLPTSTAHIITIRRFAVQGLEAGFISGLGTITGNLLFLASIILGWRFFVIPWLSLDVFRYVLGFLLLVKYMWDSYNERRMVLEDVSKRKMFFLTFLLALTEQTSIFPFLNNLSLSPDVSFLESFPAESYPNFILIHFSYLFGIGLGCFSFLHFICWFWENPAFKIYMWMITSFKVSTSLYYKILNFTFLYLTMLSAISNIPYYGLDYTITNPLGFVHEDRIIQDKLVLETSFLSNKASDRNTRRNRGRHGRRERWKRRIRKYRTFDASLYDQGIYDLFTIEDLNYGFDRFWLRRKLRNHRVRFRFFPGPWMRSFKKQLAKPRLESHTGPRMEFFRILFEQVYHPSFHALNSSRMSSGLREAQEGSFVQAQKKSTSLKERDVRVSNILSDIVQRPMFQKNALTNSFISAQEKSKQNLLQNNKPTLDNSSAYLGLGNERASNFKGKNQLMFEHSTLRKFIRKLENRLKTSEITLSFNQTVKKPFASPLVATNGKIYSKRWKKIFSSLKKNETKEKMKTTQDVQRKLASKVISSNFNNFASHLRGKISFLDPLNEQQTFTGYPVHLSALPRDAASRAPRDSAQERDTVQGAQEATGLNSSKQNVRKHLSKKDLQILRYRTFLSMPSVNNASLVSRANSEQVLDVSTKTGLQNNIVPSFLLHPLKFYLQQQKGFERKLRYYLPNVFRTYSIENNAPYFNVMMKRYFYNYKPNSRWERTMKVASLRKARRKITKIPRKLVLDKKIREKKVKGESLGVVSFAPSESVLAADAKLAQGYPSAVLSNQPGISASLSPKANSARRVVPQQAGAQTLNFLPNNRLNINTGNYSIVSKKASRYRYQIYKDVLQHWYYSPFNRVLLKFDVDDFIKRQPKTHFLTAKEENLLHLRRFLLSEHYNTLRWYTNMEHYRSMKTKLNGTTTFGSEGGDRLALSSVTKSFSSRVYNQQFAGTFKKIRHLFAITPSQTYSQSVGLSSASATALGASVAESNTSNTLGTPKQEKDLKNPEVILKFDQPLYNEYYNNANKPLLNTIMIHEELLPDDTFNSTMGQAVSLPEAKDGAQSRATGVLSRSDLLTSSTNIIREYFSQARPLRENYIKFLLSQNNYFELTQFLLKGQKLRGFEPITNQKLLNLQEKEYLLNEKEKLQLNESFNSKKLHQFLMDKNILEDLYITYLKKWKYRVNDTESVKNYLTYRIEKREKRKQKKEKQLLKKLNRLETWFFNISSVSKIGQDTRVVSPIVNMESQPIFEKTERLTTGLEKSLFDATLTLFNKKVSHKKIDLSNTQVAKKLWKTLFLSKIKQRFSKPHLSAFSLAPRDSEQASVALELRFQRNSQGTPAVLSHISGMQDGVSLNVSQKKIKEIEILVSQLKSILNTLDNTKNKEMSSFVKNRSKLYFKSKTLLKRIGFIYEDFKKSTLSLIGFSNVIKVLKPIKQKSLKNWRKKERVLGKQKRLRKEFKLLNVNKQQNKFSMNEIMQDRAPKELLTSQGSQVLALPEAKKVHDIEQNDLTRLVMKNDDHFKSKVFLMGQFLKDTLKDSQAKSLSNQANLVSSVSSREEQGRQGANLSDKQQNLLDSLQFNRKKREKTNSLNEPKDKQTDFLDSLRLTNLKESLINNWVLFKRKHTPQRRSRTRRNRGVFKKTTLGNLLRKDIQSFSILLNKKSLEDASSPSATASNTNLQKALNNKNFFYNKMNTNNMYINSKVDRDTTTLGLAERDTEASQEKFSTLLRQRSSKQKKQRFWKQKRSKYAQKRRKYRKRRRYVRGKIRVLSKQLNRIKNKIEIQNWWWKQFIPSIQASTDALWQIEKDRILQQKLSQLSSIEILERDAMNQNNRNFLQIGNKDFKPLAIPEAIRMKSLNTLPMNVTIGSEYLSNNIKEEGSLVAVHLSPQKNTSENLQLINKLYENVLLKNANNLPVSKDSVTESKQNNVYFQPNVMLPFYAGWDETLRKFVVTNRMLSRSAAGFEFKQLNNSTASLGVAGSLFAEGEEERLGALPSLKPLINTGLKEELNNSPASKVISFMNAPLQGMNAATTLYWQIPFTTFDPDQFFALGMDGFSPIGWKKFLFRHSILKNWLPEETPSLLTDLNTKNQNTLYTENNVHISRTLASRAPRDSVQASPSAKKRDTVRTEGEQGQNLEKLQALIVPSNHFQSLISAIKEKTVVSPNDMANQPSLFKNSLLLNATKMWNRKNISRRLKKRYRRVKKHPRTPVWFPSGPLQNQVLPVHYIYVFYKRSRLPRDRYLKRRLLNVKTINNSEGLNTLKAGLAAPTAMGTQASGLDYSNIDFTLRKRLKPKRKYHLKRDFYSATNVIPRRLKFINTEGIFGGSPLFLTQQNKIQRPLSLVKINKPIADFVKEQKMLRTKQRRTRDELKQQTSMTRLKQLRRRVHRQILRSVWRYRPRAGGFVWPGDYLKLELVKAPKLQQSFSALAAEGQGTPLQAHLSQQDTVSSSLAKSFETKRKIKRKRKRNLVEWQIQPKKYLYQKHNFKVLKQKLEKAQRSDKMHQKIKELNLRSLV